MANPYTYGSLGFRWTQRWEKAWPTILGRVNLLLEKVDWCKWEIDNAGPTCPAGTYDDPYVIGGAYLWHDATSHVLRVKESAPGSESDGTEIGMGGGI
jgi:hypothetical protein